MLARIETCPEDLRGMIAAEGILTARGGVSSHAALVARQMGKVCVCGALGIQIDYQKRTLSANGAILKQGDYISIDGSSGEVFAGEVTTAPSEIVRVLVDRTLDAKKSAIYQQFARLMTWVDRVPNPRGCVLMRIRPIKWKTPWLSEPKVSVSAEQSICSLRATASMR